MSLYMCQCCTWTSHLSHLCLKELLCEPGVRQQEPVLHLCMSAYKSFCTASRRDLLRTRACAALMRVSLQALSCCTYRRVCLLEPVLHLRVCVYKSFCAAPGRVFLQEPVLHLCVCVYTSFCAAPGRVYLQESVLSVYISFVLHLDISVYKSMCCTCV